VVDNAPTLVLVADPQFVALRANRWHWPGMRMPSPSPFCNLRSRNPASTRASGLKGGVFTSPRNQTSGLFVRAIVAYVQYDINERAMMGHDQMHGVCMRIQAGSSDRHWKGAGPIFQTSCSTRISIAVSGPIARPPGRRDRFELCTSRRRYTRSYSAVMRYF
jgi:hypothetical protein